MKKIYFLLLLAIISFGVKAQSVGNICVVADCTDSIQLPTPTVGLNSVGTSTSPILTYAWSAPAGVVVANPNLAKTTASGLNTVGWYVFKVTVTSAVGSASTLDSIYVKAAPPVTVIGTFVVNGKTITIYSDGTSTTK